MSELDNLMSDIEKLRKKLNDLIIEKNIDLSDPEIIAASQVLNAAITKYTEILTKKHKP